MNWFGVRSVYLFGVNSLGINVFEERIVVFCAETFDEAHIKAEREAKTYAAGGEYEMHSEQVAYKQDGDELIDGYEVWSELYESKMTLNEFYKARYEAFLYHPENA